jgi:hypothetical protein
MFPRSNGCRYTRNSTPRPRASFLSETQLPSAPIISISPRHDWDCATTVLSDAMTSPLSLTSPAPETCSVLQVRTSADQGGPSHGFRICGRVPLRSVCLCMRAEDLLSDGSDDMTDVLCKYAAIFRHLSVCARVDAQAISAGRGQELMMLQCLNKLPRYYFYTLGGFRTTPGPACATRTRGGCSTLPCIMVVRDMVRCLGRSWTAMSDAGSAGEIGSQRRAGCLGRLGRG